MKKIVLVLVVVVLVLLGVIFAMKSKTGDLPIDLSTTEETKIPTHDFYTQFATGAYWDNLIPQIRSELGSTFMGIKVEESRPLSIDKSQITKDITGDGIPEALVDLGGDGGAYMQVFTLFTSDDGKPVIAKFKDQNGIVSSKLMNAGASASNGRVIKMNPSENSIAMLAFSRGLDSWQCSDFEVYKWNPSTKTFDFNKDGVAKIQAMNCQDLLNWEY